MLTLEEAIKHYHEKAEEIRKANEEMPTDCKLSEELCECAKENEQLAGWLKDYKRLLEMPKGDLIELTDEVWKLYKKHQSHLATYVIEFGDELADLLGKYNEGGAE